MLTVETIAHRIHLSLDLWPGSCHSVAHACLKAGVVIGTLRYGLWTGPMAPGTPFAGRPVTHHGWVELADGRVWDPTRWVFEAQPPYLYIGSNDHYDLGGAHFLFAHRERPMATPPFPYMVRLPRATRDAIGHMLGMARPWSGALNQAQLSWLAAMPIDRLGVHARPLYREIIRIGQRARLQIDQRRAVLGEPA